MKKNTVICTYNQIQNDCSNDVEYCRSFNNN